MPSKHAIKCSSISCEVLTAQNASLWGSKHVRRFPLWHLRRGLMPKENSMADGTQIGYGVLLASLGIFGVAGYFYWLSQLSRRALTAGTAKNLFLLFLLTLLVCGLFTPLFVGQILLPAALWHGLIWQEGRDRCAPSS